MTTHKLETQSQALKTLVHLIKDIKVAMFTTASKHGVLQSRPMTSLGMDDNGCLWFFTTEHSEKAEEIKADQHVNVVFAEPKDSKYVSVSGTANLVRDREKIKAHYTPAMRAWFPEGLDTPDLVMIQVQAESAEYWDVPAGKMVQFLTMAMAQITGNPYPSPLRENERVNIHPH